MDSSARHLLSSVSIAGAFVGGLGLVGASTLAHVGFGWALPALVCVAASICAAAWVLVPVRKTVSPGRLDLMDQWYAAQIRRRGRLIRIAGALFAASIPLALLPLAASAIASPHTAIDVTVVRNGPKIHTIVHAVHFPHDATVTVTVRAGRPSRLLSRGLIDVDEDGAATLALDSRSRDTLAINATATNARGRSLATRTLTDPEIR